jgi:hypothetical protein
MIIAKTTREEADRYMATMVNLESTITIDVSFTLSGTTPVDIV